MKAMRQQSGFTLVEIAIVLVIIGLLLGGVLKGQELITNAKVKGLVNDYKGTAAAIYAYQDRYKALPGDDANAQAHLGTAVGVTNCTGGNCGNGTINGNNNAANGEPALLWQHLRVAGFVTGTPFSTTQNNAVNSQGSMIGVTGTQALYGGTLINRVVFASTAGNLAQFVDNTMDDGYANNGSVLGAAYTAGGTGTYNQTGTIANMTWRF